MQGFADKKRIIIAEQYRVLLEKHARYLARDALEVHSFRSNTEALVLQNKIHAELIVTGLDVPGISGEELCDQIRKDDALKHVSIIMVCRGTQEDLERCKKCKANAFISSQIDPRAFADTARKLLNVAERAAIRVPVSIKVDGKDGRGRPFLGFTENLSASGMLVESDKDLNEGDIVICSFYLEDNTQVIVNAEVARVEKKKPTHGTNQYGVKFANLAGGLLSAIENYISTKPKV